MEEENEVKNTRKRETERRNGEEGGSEKRELDAEDEGGR